MHIFLVDLVDLVQVFMFKSLHPCHFSVFEVDSCPDDGGRTDDESDHPGWRDDDVAGSRSERSEEQDTKMEERETEAMHLLSKLQDTTPRRRNDNGGHSDFEDCESETLML